MSLTKKWILTNSTAMLISFLLYTPVAHGFTGGHGRDLTTAQIIAHTIGYVITALFVFIFQRYALRDEVRITWLRIIIGMLLFIVMFWGGYYLPIPGGLDYDILAGFLVLGSAMWIGTQRFSGPWWTVVIAMLSFPFASFICELILMSIASVFDIAFDLQHNLMHHTIFWLSIGISTGLLGGWIGGMALTRMHKTTT